MNLFECRKARPSDGDDHVRVACTESSVLTNALSSQATGIVPIKVVLDFVSLGFTYLETHKNVRKCNIVGLICTRIQSVARIADRTALQQTV